MSATQILLNFYFPVGNWGVTAGILVQFLFGENTYDLG